MVEGFNVCPMSARQYQTIWTSAQHDVVYKARKSHTRLLSRRPWVRVHLTSRFLCLNLSSLHLRREGLEALHFGWWPGMKMCCEWLQMSLYSNRGRCLRLDWTKGLKLALAHSRQVTSHVSGREDRDVSQHECFKQEKLWTSRFNQECRFKGSSFDTLRVSPRSRNTTSRDIFPPRMPQT